MVREKPMGINQLSRLFVDERYAADLSRPIRVDDVVPDRSEVDHFGEGITKFVLTVVETEQTDFIRGQLAELRTDQWKNCFANLDPKLAGGLFDVRRRHFLDTVDNGEAQCASAAVEA